MLYKKLDKPNAHATQLAYRVRYWPYAALAEYARKMICWKQHGYIPKQSFIDMLNEDMTHVFYNNQEWQITWAYNNIPTQIEWEKFKGSIHVQFRVSPLFDRKNICLLDFDTANSANKFTSK